MRRVVEDALARGGTCSGEHGIGIGKIGALEQEHGDLIALMRGIKQVFDPLGIMNPGKVLREVCALDFPPGPLAQLVEQGTFNPKVAGSIPARPHEAFPAKTGFGRAPRDARWLSRAL